MQVQVYAASTSAKDVRPIVQRMNMRQNEEPIACREEADDIIERDDLRASEGKQPPIAHRSSWKEFVEVA